MQSGVEARSEKRQALQSYIRAASQCLSSKTPVVIIGAPGSGKSLLAREVSETDPAVIVDEAQYLQRSNPELYANLVALHENATPLMVIARRLYPDLQSFVETVQATVLNLSPGTRQ